jgi:tetratricopeptide (TPR) repeat protein
MAIGCGKVVLRIEFVADFFIALCFCITAYQRNLVWKDEIALWRNAVLLSPTSARPHANLGKALGVKGFLAEAEWESMLAMQLNPYLAEAHNNLGNIYPKKGLLADALRELRRAVDLKPFFPEALITSGWSIRGWGSLMRRWRSSGRQQS